jgi:hypothetical protein
MAHVYAPYTDELGYPTVLHELHGSFEMTLADEDGESVTVSASF